MHSSSTRTIKTVEHFDQEGRLTKRVTTDTWDEIADLNTEASDEPDEKTLSEPPKEFRLPTIQPSWTFPSLPQNWEVYCVNGIEPCPAHDIRYPGRSAG